MTTGTACDACLRRSWLLARLSGHLDRVRHRIGEVLALGDHDLIAAVGGREAELVSREAEGFDPGLAHAECERAELRAICRCAGEYPARLRALDAAPAVLHVVGEGRLPGAADEGGAAGGGGGGDETVAALVGARRAGPYALGVAHDLARGIAGAGIPVVSGLALGVDSAAHEGALAGGGLTVAVLPAAPERPYPASRRALHARICAEGVALAELGPGVPVRRWMFPARNRIIAALADVTVVVAAGERSGAMVTARVATALGRVVGAVPGPVGSRLSAGPHELLRRGARLIAGVEDVLDALLGPDRPPRSATARDELEGELAQLLAALGEGRPTAEAFAVAGLDAARGMAALAALELVGYVRREPGGRYSARI